MSSFSERIGAKPVNRVLQVDSMDAALRNGLWNALVRFFWSSFLKDPGRLVSSSPSLGKLFPLLWVDYFKEPLDTFANFWPKDYKRVQSYFFAAQWNEVYDFVEFVAKNHPSPPAVTQFVHYCNVILQREASAYRFIGNEIASITSEEEIAEIEQAVETPLTPVANHLKTALQLAADRESPDYRNSVKESISAVEAICALIVGGNEQVTLGKALNRIEGSKKIEIDTNLKAAFKSLYAFTSEAEGIRHAMLNEPNVRFEDAKFMLVSCSAFVNYLIAKAAGAGLSLDAV